MLSMESAGSYKGTDPPFHLGQESAVEQRGLGSLAGRQPQEAKWTSEAISPILGKPLP